MILAVVVAIVVGGIVFQNRKSLAYANSRIVPIGDSIFYNDYNMFLREVPIKGHRGAIIYKRVKLMGGDGKYICAKDNNKNVYNDKNDAAKDDADADEHIMRNRFTFNRKTVMRAARNVAVPEPDWRSCCASANPIRRWRSERASRQATGLVRAGESLSDQRFTRFCWT